MRSLQIDELAQIFPTDRRTLSWVGLQWDARWSAVLAGWDRSWDSVPGGSHWRELRTNPQAEGQCPGQLQIIAFLFSFKALHRICNCLSRHRCQCYRTPPWVKPNLGTLTPENVWSFYDSWGLMASNQPRKVLGVVWPKDFPGYECLLSGVGRLTLWHRFMCCLWWNPHTTEALFQACWTDITTKTQGLSFLSNVNTARHVHISAKTNETDIRHV